MHHMTRQKEINDRIKAEKLYGHIEGRYDPYAHKPVTDQDVCNMLKAMEIIKANPNLKVTCEFAKLVASCAHVDFSRGWSSIKID